MAAAAYRAAENLYCERTGIRANYANRGGVEETFIVTPSGAEWAQDRSTLWNAVEAKERYVNARTAREIRIALPAELAGDERSRLVHEFAQALAERYGVAVDVAIHAPSVHGDQRNHHAHLLMTTRQVSAEGLGAKSEFELSNTQLLAKGLPKTQKQVREVRALWEHKANLALAQAGHEERIDARSYAERGIDLEPTVHLGPGASAIVRKGREAEMAQASQDARSASAELLRIHPEKAIAVVEREKSVFDRRDVARVVHRFVSDPVLFQNILERAIAHESVVALAPEFRDPGSGKVVQQARFATKDMIRIEHKMVETAVTLSERGGFKTAEARVGETLARFEQQRGFALNAEQEEAVRHVTQDRAFAAIVGLAGTGKSTMLEVTRQIYEAEGHRVFGAALAGKAAAEFTKSSGIEARTLASWELRWRNGRELLREGDVFVVDEAGMVSSRQMARIVEIVESAKAKLVLVGDPEQLQPIQAGAAFRAIVEKTGYLELSDIRRQKEDWQRAASVDLSRGRIEQAIGAYQAYGLVAATRTIEEAHAEIVTDWFATRDPSKTAVVLGYRNKDVDAINGAIRDQRIARGEIDAGHQFSSAQRRTKPSDSIEIEETSADQAREISFSRGDRVLLGKGWGELKNGLLGTVTRSLPNEIDVKLDNTGNTVTINAESYRHVSLGYAMTIHKAQGVTADRSFVLASPVDDRHLAYVAMTRHRDEAKLYYATEDFKNQTLVEGLSRSRAKEATTDYHVVIDAFLERRGLESRRSFADRWATYVESTRAWVHEKRERLEAVWQRFESLIGQRQAQAAELATPLFAASTAPSGRAGVDDRIEVPALSKATLATLDQMRQSQEAGVPSRRQAAEQALTDSVFAKEVGAVAAALEKRFGPWQFGLGRHIAGSQGLLEQEYGKAVGAVLARHSETLRTVHYVQELTREQTAEVLAREQRAPAWQAKPLFAAVREFPLTVEQVAREGAANTYRYKTSMDSVREAAFRAVRRPEQLVKEVETYIRAHAYEKTLDQAVEPHVMARGDGIAGLRGSTAMFDFAGKRERAEALQALLVVAAHAAHAARAYQHGLEKARETEQASRSVLAIEIPELSRRALTYIAALEQARGKPKVAEKVMGDIEADKAVKQELDAHHRAMRARFGIDYAQPYAERQMREAVREQERARIPDAVRAGKAMEEAHAEITMANELAMKAKQGVTFG
ncbi:Ti-type conjugative transfer relaxase TraA [Rhizobiales bacterium GAS191]|nr:Ti-type conjugative transfer relaxase TraA [Rhizobiales bacterium GAS191]